MHRFFLTDRPIRCGDTLDLGRFHRQLSRVLRMRPGDRILLLDGTGQEYLTELQYLDGRRTTGMVLEQRASPNEPDAHITLYQCALKRDKMKWVLQKGTELGVSLFVPVMSERTVVQPASALLRKYDRWRAIIREAAEQSGRGALPELAEPMAWGEAVKSATGLRLIPWERADSQPGLAQAVRQWLHANSASLQVNLLIGPEGGISEAEMSLALAHEWRPVTLGPRTLRAETAALTSVAIVMSALGEMN